MHRSIRVEAGETVILSPESDRFREHYRRVQPRSAKEARDLIGLSDEMAHSLREAGACCEPSNQQASFPTPDDLESDDEKERGRAFDDVGRGFASFLTTTNPELLAPLEPAIELYLSLTNLELNVVALHNIVVDDGATWIVSDDTHLVEANTIVIHGSGQINCSGFTRMNVNSLAGTA